ncbi:MAG: IS3 family transposase [Thiomicrorhabdus sp.]|nr:IS3 family transposase [Thiomicrorhabdus sp.]
MLALCNEAVTAGATQKSASEIIGISAKTLQRWKEPENVSGDGRKTRTFIPKNKLTQHEREKIINTVNSVEFRSTAPNQIVPILAERGEYIASERTFYRVLNEENQLKHRHRSKPASVQNKPKSLSATGPGQLLSWDITYLKTTVAGVFFYLYLFMDIFSRKLVGWQIHELECSKLASDIVIDIARREGYHKDQEVHVHSDNGSSMKAATLLATFQHLGITPSYSRPSVSNDNPYSESLFKTLKYCPHYPSKPFASLLTARTWMHEFAGWYNNQHRHSRIQYVTPSQRHSGQDKAVLEARATTYENAKQAHPERWTGNVRDWGWQEEVMLNQTKQNQKMAKLL